MVNAVPYMEWGQNKRVDISSLEDLTDRINILSREAQQNGMPFSVQLRKNEDTGLLFTVGFNISHLEFYSVKGSPIITGSLGSWEPNDESITVLHGDEPSEMEKKYFIPFDEALRGIEEYFLTGNRPRNIQWG